MRPWKRKKPKIFDGLSMDKHYLKNDSFEYFVENLFSAKENCRL